MSTPLLTTKLYRPPPRPQSVRRQRLLAQLDAGLARRLTLITAPAGFGKTTLISQWLAGAAQPVAWLTLDESDSEPTRFLAYLLTAVQTAAPQLGAEVLATLLAPQPPPLTTALTALINALAALPHPITLVLDDYHQVNAQSVDQALSFILDHQPPQLHLIITTREEPHLPLARLRARGQLTELRAADLRFTRTEAAELLHRALGLTLAAEVVAALEARTEGWAAGLHLAALSLSGRHDTAEFLQAFSGNHRFVRDYLFEEVFQQQPAPIQQFLLRTAILDQLCGPLCDALVSPETSTFNLHPSSRILAELERANLFLVPLDDEQRWYRYHHLFGEFLRQRLTHEPDAAGETVAALHLRASRWYASEGLDLEALRHAAAAADPAYLAYLAEQAWQRMDSSFQTAAWRHWVQQLPEAMVQTRPELCIQYANVLLMDAGELEAAEARLIDAERGLTDAAQHTILHARIAVARAYLAQSRGDVATMVQHATRARAFDLADNPLLHAQADAVLTFAHWAGGELEAAYRILADWVAYARQSGNLAFALATGFYLGEIRIAQGQLREAARIYRRFLQEEQADDAALRQAAPHLHLGLALVAYEQGDAPTAAQHMQESKELGTQAALIDWPFRWHLAQARIHESTGEWDAALNLLDAAEQRYARNPVPDTSPIAALKAHVQIKQGNLIAARNWAAAHNLSATDELSYLREFEHITLARLLLARYRHERADGHLHAAHDLLTRLLAAAESGGRTASIIEILLLQALAHEAQGELQAALTALERALALAQPEGYVRIFVDEGLPLARLLEQMNGTDHAMQKYLQNLRTAFGEQPDLQPSALSLPPLIETLSERERQVLSLIAAGLSNQELAAQLYLSLHTVKVHTRNIYGKLGVTSRTQAVARGRALGILDLPE